MNILITGANGMLGEQCTRLLASNYNVVTTDLAEKGIPGLNSNYLRMDITDLNQVLKIVDHKNPDFVINCAAYTDVDGCELHQDKAVNVNIKGIENLLRATSNSNCHVIHISTDYVFDGSQGPYREDDKTNPINFYGKTKLESEKVLLSSNVDWTIIRTNVLYGNSYNRQASFVNWVISNLSKGKSINVVNDQYGNPTWADGLAQILRKIVENKSTGLYHYAGLDYLNRFEFALIIAKTFALDSTMIRPIFTSALKQDAKRPYKGGLVSDKIKAELDVPLFSIKESLEVMKGSN